MRFVLDHLAGMAEIATFPGFEDTDPGLFEAVLTQPVRFAMLANSDIGGQGNASGSLERRRGNAEIRQPRLLALSDADHGRGRLV
jgi:hypothetical protein